MQNFCTKCGAKINEGIKFCTKCGAELGDSVSKQPSIVSDFKGTDIKTKYIQLKKLITNKTDSISKKMADNKKIYMCVIAIVYVVFFVWNIAFTNISFNRISDEADIEEYSLSDFFEFYSDADLEEKAGFLFNVSRFYVGNVGYTTYEITHAISEGFEDSSGFEDLSETIGNYRVIHNLILIVNFIVYIALYICNIVMLIFVERAIVYGIKKDYKNMTECAECLWNTMLAFIVMSIGLVILYNLMLGNMMNMFEEVFDAKKSAVREIEEYKIYLGFVQIVLCLLVLVLRKMNDRVIYIQATNGTYIKNTTKTGSWYCSECNALNQAEKTSCSVCSANRSRSHFYE